MWFEENQPSNIVPTWPSWFGLDRIIDDYNKGLSSGYFRGVGTIPFIRGNFLRSRYLVLGTEEKFGQSRALCGDISP